MRLDHLLSKETGEVGSCIVCFLILSQANLATDAGGGLPAQGGGKANSFGESRIMSKRKAAKRRFCEVAQSNKSKASGGDAPGGHTRSHPEHDG